MTRKITFKTCHKCLQLGIWAICIVLCVINVQGTLRSYFDGETIQTISKRPPVGEVQFPSLAICPQDRKQIFKSESKPMVTLEDYNDNTFDPTDFNITFWYGRFENIPSRYKEEFLLTNELGKCLYYKMDENDGECLPE